MTSASPAVRERRNDIDWLRIGATYLLFLFHVGKIFDVGPFYHIKNAELVPGLRLPDRLHPPVADAPLLPAGGLVALRLARGAREAHLSGRAHPAHPGALCGRMPPLRAVPALRRGPERDLRHARGRRGPGRLPGANFLEFLPHFFTLEAFSWAHLWFLIYLYVFTRLYLPLFQRLIERHGEPREWSAAWVYAPILPLALIQVTMRGRWPGMQNLYDDWANFLFYSLFFIAGFLFARYPELERAAHREWRRASLLGLAACLAMELPWQAVLDRPELAVRALSGAAAWACVLGLLGFARQHLTADRAALRYLRESSLPIYILHSPAIVLVGYWVIPLDASIPEKFALILAGSVTLAMLAYHLAVSRFRPLRVVFGMRV